MMRPLLACLGLAVLGCATVSNDEKVRELVRQATRCRVDGDDARAIALTGEAIQLSPDHIEARLLRAAALSEEKRLEEAVAEYTEVLARDRANPIALAGRALAWSDLDHHEEAILDAQRLGAAPGTDAILLRGYVLQRAGRTADAERDYAEARRLDPDRWRAYFNLGAADIRVGRLASAERRLEMARALAPGLIEIHLALGCVHGRLAAFEKAIGDYDRALELSPNDAGIFYLRGEIHRAMRLHAEAVVDFSRAIELRSEPHVLVARGVVRQALGELDGAEADFTEAIRIDGTTRAAYHHRAVIRHRRKQLDEAEQDFRTALLMSFAIDDLRGLASVYADKDQVDSAIDLYERALKLPLEAPVAAELRAELADLRKRKK